MDINKDELSGALTISGTLDIDAANLLRQALLDCSIKHQRLEADLTGVDACDASALQVLLAAQTNNSLFISGISNAVTEMATSLGFTLGRQNAV